MNGIHDGQLSLFDLFAAPQAAEPVLDPRPAVIEESQPVSVHIQASTLTDDKSFRVYGKVRAEIIPSAWSVTASEVLSMFPVIADYYMPRGLMEREYTVRLHALEIDANGAFVEGGRKATAEVTAAELFAAAGS